MAPGAGRPQDRGMRSRATRLAFALAVYATVMLVASAALSVGTHIHAGPSPHWSIFVEIALALTFGPIAVMIVSRQPRNPIPWLLLFFACVAPLAARRELLRPVDGRRRDVRRRLGRMALVVDDQPGVRVALHPAAAAVPDGATRIAALPSRCCARRSRSS